MEEIFSGIIQLVGGTTRYFFYKLCGSKKSFGDFVSSDDNKKSAEEVSHGCLNYIVGVIVCGIIIFLAVWFIGSS